jgi:transposase
VDRRKKGSKHHLLTDARGTPIAFTLTGANRHDVTQLLPLLDKVRPVGCRRGHPRKRFNEVMGDRAYHSEPHRRELRRRRIRPRLARRGAPHGSGLGKYRWVVERGESWVHQYRRLKLRYDRDDAIHEAFLSITCALICLDCWKNPFC